MLSLELIGVLGGLFVFLTLAMARVRLAKLRKKSRLPKTSAELSYSK